MRRNRESISVSPREYDISGLPTRFFNPGELDVLLHLYEMASPKVVIEFGVNTGRNAVAALRNIEGITRYIGIDVTRDYQTIKAVQRKEIPSVPGELALGYKEFDLIVRPRGSFDLTPDDLPLADVVFIDADHSYDGVMNDYRLAKAITREGGIIIFHDDNCLPVVDVTETLNEICEGGAVIKHIEGTWLSYEVV